MRVLVVNCGSSSIKYQVIDTTDGRRLAASNIENIGHDPGFEKGIAQMLDGVRDLGIEAVGHRVVHGGERFRSATRLDEARLTAIKACTPLAPLHNPRNIEGIRATLAAFPDLPQAAVFDTAFHASIPEAHARYALPRMPDSDVPLRRFGFHGSSHAWVSRKASEYIGGELATQRIVSLHLGNGASACAIRGGHSVDTSMGLTPLEGLVMGTRCGDVDPGLLLMLQRSPGMSPDQLDRILNRESGLLGLSGLSADMRTLTKAAEEGHAGARLAIDVFVHRIRKYLGAYLAVLNGADAVVFTGGIGENSSHIRERVSTGFEYAGLMIDADRNAALIPGKLEPVNDVSQRSAKIRILVIPTDEEMMIASETAEVLTRQND